MQDSSINKSKKHICSYHHQVQTHTCEECGIALCDKCVMRNGKHEHQIVCPECYEQSLKNSVGCFIGFLFIFTLFSLMYLVIEGFDSVGLTIVCFFDFLLIFFFVISYFGSKSELKAKRAKIHQYRQNYEKEYKQVIDSSSEIAISEQIDKLDLIFEEWEHSKDKKLS